MNNKIKIDKIASSLKNINLPHEVDVSKHLDSCEGEAIVVQAQEAQGKYGELELTSGRMAKIYKGDLIAGVLGERKALDGIVGILPKSLKPGSILHILSLGGVIGKAVSWNKDIIGKPIAVKVIGVVIKNNKSVNLHNFSFRTENKLGKSAPLILVAGTAMNTGKTTVACQLIHLLTKEKRAKVAAAKLTGVATQKDLLAMKDAGAEKNLSFHDLGLASTLNNHNRMVPVAKTILNQLNKIKPNIIIVELGDGIIGWYGVDKLLKDKELVRAVKFSIVCAHDLIGARAAFEIFKISGLTVDFFSGPVTNNTAGTDYLEKILKIPAQDLRSKQSKLIKALRAKGVLGK